jgi:hypothetical protein
MQDFAAGGFWTGSCGVFKFGRGARANGDVDSFASEFLGDGMTQSFIDGRDDSHAAFEPHIQYMNLVQTSHGLAKWAAGQIAGSAASDLKFDQASRRDRASLE